MLEIKNMMLEVKNTLIGLKKVNNSEKISAFKDNQWKLPKWPQVKKHKENERSEQMISVKYQISILHLIRARETGVERKSYLKRDGKIIF